MVLSGDRPLKFMRQVIQMPTTIKTLRTRLIGTLALCLLAGCASGLSTEARINNNAEIQWVKFLEAIPQSSNANLTLHVRTLAGAILIAADETPEDWQVALFESPETVNAFALPNKRIGVFTGLLVQTANDDQLAAVIGHEIAHVRLSHTAERINRGILPNVVSGVAKLPGAITDIGVLERAGEITSGAVKIGAVLPFDRAQESEADLEGLTYMAKAGFDPEQAAIFWQQMSANSNGSIEVLSTHPSSARRVRALEDAARKLKVE